MQPTDGDEHRERPSNGTSNYGGANSATNGTTGLFGFSSFGATPAKPVDKPESTPTKRPSIDESWVNVDWNEISRRSNPQSPAKSPKLEHGHPMASVYQPASELESKRDLFGNEQKQTSTFGTPSRSFDAPKPHIPTPQASMHVTPQASHASTTHATPGGLFGAPKPQTTQTTPQTTFHHTPVHTPVTKPTEPVKAPVVEHKAQPVSPPRPTQKSPETKPMTPAREPAPTVPPTISHPPVCTPKAEVHTPSRITKIDTPKVEKAETPKVEKAETPKATPKVEKTETPKTVTPKASTPKVATPKAATPKVTPKATPKETTPRSSGRQRKTVDRLSPEALDRTPTKEIEIPSGHGSKLGDIAHIGKELTKRKADFAPLVMLHRLAFGRPGEAAKRKAHLRLFSGFENEAEVGKASEKLAHHTVDELREVCAVLNVDRSGEKKALAERIAKFLYKPTDLGESKPPLKRTPTKRSKTSPKGGKAKVAKRGSPNKDASGAEETTSEDGDDEMIADLEKPEAGADA